MFAYTITIKNHSLCNAKLHSRYWLITDANGKETEVEGEGVVGEQPLFVLARAISTPAARCSILPLVQWKGFI